jgi:hypothetical protein
VVSGLSYLGSCHLLLTGCCSDVHPDSRITLKITKRNRLSSDRVRIAEYLVSDVADQASMTISASTQASRSISFVSTSKKSRGDSQNDTVAVTLKFWGSKEVRCFTPDGQRLYVLDLQVEDAYSGALARSKVMLESHKGPLERIGRARPVLETIIEFGEAITDVSRRRYYSILRLNVVVDQPQHKSGGSIVC